MGAVVKVEPIAAVTGYTTLQTDRKTTQKKNLKSTSGCTHTRTHTHT